MSKLEKKVSRRKTLLGHDLASISVRRKDGKKLIDPKDIKQIAQELHKKAINEIGDDFKIYLRVWAGDRPHTFNVDEQGDVEKFDVSDDYYVGKVKNESKFLKYYRVDFYVNKY